MNQVSMRRSQFPYLRTPSSCLSFMLQQWQVPRIAGRPLSPSSPLHLLVLVDVLVAFILEPLFHGTIHVGAVPEPDVAEVPSHARENFP